MAVAYLAVDGPITLLLLKDGAALIPIFQELTFFGVFCGWDRAQVWVPALSDREDMEGVVQKAFRFGKQDLSTSRQNLSEMAGPMLDFAWWFNNTVSF